MEAAQKQESPPADEGREAVRAARTSRKPVTPEQESAAVEWFLSDEEPQHKTVEINVGTEEKEHWVPWEVRPVDLDALRRIRKASQNTRGRGGATDVDEVQANLRIVVAGTVKPDLKEMATRRQVAAPEEALRLRFASKPGLLGQIAGEILSLSGYDDADLRDPTSVGN